MRHLTAIERFWAKVEKGDGCWMWSAKRDRNGYGRFYLDGAQRRAHRVSYEFAHGPIEDGMQIDHMCHNRACVRPDHLRAATNKQNQENRKVPPANNTSGFIGVSWHRRFNKWLGAVVHNGETIHVGYFLTAAEAGDAVRRKRVELYTHNDVDRIAS